MWGQWTLSGKSECGDGECWSGESECGDGGCYSGESGKYRISEVESSAERTSEGETDGFGEATE